MRDFRERGSFCPLHPWAAPKITILNRVKDIFPKNGKNQNIVFEGDFNINFLDFETNKDVKDFLNLMFCYNIIPLTNKPTRVNRHSANTIDHMITNSVTGHNGENKKDWLVRSFSYCFCRGETFRQSLIASY